MKVLFFAFIVLAVSSCGNSNKGRSNVNNSSGGTQGAAVTTIRNAKVVEVPITPAQPKTDTVIHDGRIRLNGKDITDTRKTCSTCRGKGNVKGGKCSTCLGHGTLRTY